VVLYKLKVYLLKVAVTSGFFFWASCCGLRQTATNRTIAAVVYGP
jgi:hypothetical protein